VKQILAVLCFGIVIAPAAPPANASGSYSCCFINENGKQYTHKGRASSYYKGTIERLCRVVALEIGAEQCESERNVTDLAAELDFTSDEFPEEYDISEVCHRFPCEIGLLVRRDKSDDENRPSDFTSLSVENEGLVCELERQIEGDIRGYNLKVSKPNRMRSSGACKIVILGSNGTSTSNFVLGQ
jgi:hypothetical protein